MAEKRMIWHPLGELVLKWSVSALKVVRDGDRVSNAVSTYGYRRWFRNKNALCSIVN
jgi:hypothetical protein